MSRIWILDWLRNMQEIMYTEAAQVTRFENYRETIPGTGVAFEMVAIPGGTFKMGSPKEESLRDNDEGPVRQVKVSGFWMGRVEVTWDEYHAFFKATSSQGRTEGQVIKNRQSGCHQRPHATLGST